jgi:hypothetical protein
MSEREKSTDLRRTAGETNARFVSNFNRLSFGTLRVALIQQFIQANP